MKKFLLPALACGICVSGFAQINPPPIEPWVQLQLIVTDKTTNMVYARKVDGGDVFSFTAKKEDLRKLLPEDKISAQVNNHRIHINGTKAHAEEDIWVTNLNMLIDPSHDFYITLLIIADHNKEVIKQVRTDPEMNIIGRSESNRVKACCDAGTPNGIEFTIPAGMVESDLEPRVHIYKKLVLSNKQANSHLLVFPISGYWVDSTWNPDTTATTPNMIDYGNIYAKPNTGETEKWVVNKSLSKNSTGKIIVKLPKDAAWDMTLYAAGSQKVISNTMLKTSFTLVPGKYDVEVNKIRVTGIPVEKGNETRLKAGVLRIANATSWTLYDETKQTVLINSLDAQTRGLPVGKYKLTIMGQDIDIEIKDGETIEY